MSSQPENPLTVEEPTRRDNRHDLRRRVIKSGLVVFDGGAVSHSVIVRDISEHGAQLKQSSPFLMPDHFWLHVELDGFKVECERTWAKGLGFGAHFIGPKMPIRGSRSQVVRSVL